MSNETIQTIYERRAIRKYKDQPVERKLIEEIIEAGKMAPSAVNEQPWKFYVVTDKKEIKHLSNQIAVASAKKMAKAGLKKIVKSAASFIHSPHDLSFLKEGDFIFHGAPVVVFLTSPKDKEWAALDIGMCSQNMMLAAKSLGIDSCPVGLAKFIEGTKAYLLLNLPETDHVNLAIIFGYGDESAEVKERKSNNVFFIN